MNWPTRLCRWTIRFGPRFPRSLRDFGPRFLDTWCRRSSCRSVDAVWYNDETGPQAASRTSRRAQQEQLTGYALANEIKIEPTEEVELRLRDVWAVALGTSAEEIGKNTSFLQIGGDSISAIQLVAAAPSTALV